LQPLAAAALSASLALLPGAVSVSAQAPAAQPAPAAPAASVSQPPGQQPQAAVVDPFRQEGAQETRSQLQQILRRLPPAVSEVLQIDPSLLQRADYLTPYPLLAGFVQQHPEVLRNPGFFFGSRVFRERNASEAAVDMFENILGGLAALTGFAFAIGLIVWLTRTVIDHRKWLRSSRVQAEVHTKLLDRLTSNEDLLTYIQSPAGRHFLESAPIALDGERRQPSAPLSRIIWSLQASMVLMALGLGMFAAQSRVPTEVGQGLIVLGTVVFALGVGFAASGVLAYVVTSKFGLVPSKPAAP
jgi:hypothetical protein